MDRIAVQYPPKAIYLLRILILRRIPCRSPGNKQPGAAAFYLRPKWTGDGADRNARDRETGGSLLRASRHIGIPFRTVQRWLACGVFPERKERRFPNSVDEFGEHLEKRYRDGCRNATQLWREIKQLGFSGKGCSVWRWLRRRFGANGEVSVSPRASRAFPISPQHVAWLIRSAVYLADLACTCSLRRCSSLVSSSKTLGPHLFNPCRCKSLPF
jgi:hypothetical protein